MLFIGVLLAGALVLAGPALRERLCSSWTVTLHHQVLPGRGEVDAGPIETHPRLRHLEWQPDGFALFLGTMFAPTQDRAHKGQGFTHALGDVVTVSSPRLGALVNRVNTSDRIAPWTYGAGALMACLSDGIDRDVAEPLALGIAAWQKAQAQALPAPGHLREGFLAGHVQGDLTGLLQRIGRLFGGGAGLGGLSALFTRKVVQ